MTSPVTGFGQSGDMRRRECILRSTAAERTTLAITPDAKRRVHAASASTSRGISSAVGQHGGV